MRFPVSAAVGALTVLALAGVGRADAPLSAEEFDAQTQGRTLYFYTQGQAYGAEQYKPDRKVTWTFLDGECKEGHWYPQGQFICFVYEGLDSPQCWTFYSEGPRLRALFEDRDGETELYEAGEAEEPLFCLGPKIGV